LENLFGFSDDVQNITTIGGTEKFKIRYSNAWKFFIKKHGIAVNMIPRISQNEIIDLINKKINGN
jgi:hypothetical protein